VGYIKIRQLTENSASLTKEAIEQLAKKGAKAFVLDLCDNPGLNDGFVCQGICVNEENGKILLSGYMADHSASRIYVTNEDNQSYYVSLEYEGEAFTGHAGGIAIGGDTVYVASENALHAVPLDALLSSENGAVLQITERYPVNNEASSLYCDDTYLYVGEFHDGGQYVTEHPYLTEDGTYFAIVTRYPLSDLSTPDKIYSIRDKVQGLCFAPDGTVMLATSYGLADSVYYVYNEADCTDSGLTLDGAPVYLMDDCIYQFNGPAMAEGLDWYNGKIITMTESACNKYIYGKFFFANQIVAFTPNW